MCHTIIERAARASISGNSEDTAARDPEPRAHRDPYDICNDLEEPLRRVESAAKCMFAMADGADDPDDAAALSLIAEVVDTHAATLRALFDELHAATSPRRAS